MKSVLEPVRKSLRGIPAKTHHAYNDWAWEKLGLMAKLGMAGYVRLWIRELLRVIPVIAMIGVIEIAAPLYWQVQLPEILKVSMYGLNALFANFWIEGRIKRRILASRVS
ncbi:MAG: hypothetical protein Q7K44_00965 [Candidatus Liptonbacteria bacterium]|nr:hypothetical protein [Candidatus Liptonbacteria bacterium]